MTGTCEDMRLLVQADCDGELNAHDAAEVAGHVAHCAACARLQADLIALAALLSGTLTRHAAPAGLRRAVLGRVAGPRPGARRAGPSMRDSGWFGAGLALAASVAVLLTGPALTPPVNAIVDAHVRALQPGHLIDVASSDRHTVKPWFDGRLDFAPPVRDFSPQGFPLIGGRLDYLEGRGVASLVYGRDKHLIDVFIWPGNQPASRASARGYNADLWSQDGMNFRAVSDLNAAELAELHRLWSAPE